MPLLTNAPMAAARPTATVAVAHRSAVGTCRCRTMVRARMPRNDSITPDAARSCRNVFAVIGISPTRERWTPTEAISTTSTAEDRRPRTRFRIRRSECTRSAKTVMRTPVTVIVELNVYPEKSWKVPSSLKCSRHQYLSGVVAIDRRVPVASNVMTSTAMPRAVNHGGTAGTTISRDGTSVATAVSGGGTVRVVIRQQRLGRRVCSGLSRPHGPSHRRRRAGTRSFPRSDDLVVRPMVTCRA